MLKRTSAANGQPEELVTAMQPAQVPFEGVHGRVRSHLPEWIAISLFAGLVALVIPRHEPFADEAQAWQLARSLSLPALFRDYIRYEASPGLWHFLLWILVRMHVSYMGLHWICGAIATVSAAILIFRSPFPNYIRLSLPFTYFLIFQYAIVARSYVLVPLLLFLVGCFWRRQPLAIAFLLGLLANLSLHAAVISGGLAIAYFIQHLRDASRRQRISRQHLICGAILLAFYSLAIWTAWPPHDLDLTLFRGHSRPHVLLALGSLFTGLFDPWIVGIPFWIVIILFLHSRKSLIYLSPVALYAIFSGTTTFAWWHAGLIVPLLITVLWISWPEPNRKPTRYDVMARTALVCMAGMQMIWAGYAIEYDYLHPFSPDYAASQFLKTLVGDNDTIVVTGLREPLDLDAFLSVGILPYFNRSIYANEPYPFWWWSGKNRVESGFEDLLPSRPRIVMVETKLAAEEKLDLNLPKVVLLTRLGYRLTNVFCGSMPMRPGLSMTTCHLIFQIERPPQTQQQVDRSALPSH